MTLRPNPELDDRSIARKIAAYERALKPEELARYLNLSRNTVIRLAKKGRIPSFKIGGTVRFDLANIARWLIQMGMQRR